MRSADGAVEEGSHVVVTVPLGVLKRGAPRFSPALPPDRLAAIERLGFGRFEKVALRFDEPFWRDAGFSHLMIFPPDPGQSAVWVIGLDAFGAGPALVCLVFHSAAGRVIEATSDVAAEWVLGMLAEAIGGPCPVPSAVAVTSWASDPYTGGAYTHIPPGASPADVDLLGEPVGGRLLFAGEHTQSARAGLCRRRHDQRHPRGEAAAQTAQRPPRPGWLAERPARPGWLAERPARPGWLAQRPARPGQPVSPARCSAGSAVNDVGVVAEMDPRRAQFVDPLQGPPPGRRVARLSGRQPVVGGPAYMRGVYAASPISRSAGPSAA